MKTIRSIDILWRHDESADVSHLETTAESHYGDNGASWAHLSLDERAKVEAEHGSIFAACEQYAREDAARLKAFHDGDWHMEGCYAQAEVVVDGVRQKIRSAGLWGIESDSGSEFRREVEGEETQALLEILESLGFDTSEHRTKAKAA